MTPVAYSSMTRLGGYGLCVKNVPVRGPFSADPPLSSRDTSTRVWSRRPRSSLLVPEYARGSTEGTGHVRWFPAYESGAPMRPASQRHRHRLLVGAREHCCSSGGGRGGR